MLDQARVRSARVEAQNTARRLALEEVRDRIMSLQADASEIAEFQRAPFKGGYSTAKNAAQRLINQMLAE